MLICFQARYDIDHALVLAQMHHFKAGILYLYEKAKLWVHMAMLKNIVPTEIFEGNAKLVIELK